jgi:hypothetical protein
LRKASAKSAGRAGRRFIVSNRSARIADPRHPPELRVESFTSHKKLRASRDTRTHVSAITQESWQLSLNFVRVHPTTPAERLTSTRLDTPSLAKQITQLTKRSIDHPVCKAGHHPVGEATALFEINVKKINVQQVVTVLALAALPLGISPCLPIVFIWALKPSLPTLPLTLGPSCNVSLRYRPWLVSRIGSSI